MTGIDPLRKARRVACAFPDNGGALSNLANHLRRGDQLGEALSWSCWAVRPEAWPQGRIDPRAYRVQAETLVDLGRFAEADAVYRRLDPDGSMPVVQWSRSRALMGLEDWPQAWALAEQRFRLEELPVAALAPPHWQGWPMVRNLQVWDEQGFGDSLQALRWLPAALNRVERLHLHVRQPLVSLLRQGLAWLGPRLTISDRQQLSSDTVQQQCHGSLLSLPVLLGAQNLAPGHVLRLPRRDGERAPGLRVGLVWESGRYLNDDFHSLEYRRKTLTPAARDQLRLVLEQRGVELVSLQLGDAAVPDGADFLQQAQALLSCHLLLTVDTAAAHLAGALDFPTWLMLPWSAASRFQRGRSTTPLYRSLRLFRQSRPGDWDAVVQELLQSLDQRRAAGLLPA